MVSIVAVTGCQHFNSKVAVCPPTVTDDDGGTYRASRAQLWLWQCWQDYWTTVGALRQKYRAKLYEVFLGDLVDGPDHHETPQVISRNEITQHRIAIAGLQPALDLDPDYKFFLRGTEVHVGKSGKWEEFIAEDVGGQQDKETGNYSWWWLPLEVEGVNFDIAHHGRAGGRWWTGLGATANQAVELVMDYVDDGLRPPDVVLRAHTHKWLDSWNNLPLRWIQIPSWQLQTAHGNRLKPGKLLPIGGYIFICHKGQYHAIEKIYKPQRRIPWSESR